MLHISVLFMWLCALGVACLPFAFVPLDRVDSFVLTLNGLCPLYSCGSHQERVTCFGFAGWDQTAVGGHTNLL
jgi:hypothetical protein